MWLRGDLWKSWLYFVWLVFASCDSGPPSDMTDPGQLLYLGYTKKSVNCGRCHGPEGQGGTEAPEIKSALDKYSEDEIKAIILNGKGKAPNDMPPFEGEVDDKQMMHLINFMRTLR